MKHKPLTILCILFCGLFNIVKAQDLTNGLVSVWEFDETSGSIASDSYGSNNGTITSVDINQIGKIDKCYGFTAENYGSYAELGDIDVSPFDGSTSTLSISFWYKKTETNGANVVSKYTALSGNQSRTFYIHVSSENYLRFFVGDNSSWQYYHTETITFNVNTWYHIVVIANIATDLITTYCDNVSYPMSLIGSSGSDLTRFYNGTTSLNLGHLENSDGSYVGFGGDTYIDQVSLWNRALSSSEVSQLYNSGNGLPYSQWSGPAQLAGGTISPDTLTIDYNESPGIISSTASASGGSESYTYQWQSSTDSGNNWSDISAATSISYTPQALIQTTWFRRRVTDGTDTTYSNNSEITVTIPGGGGTITSVALASDDFTVTGSPITSSGTITVNLANASVDAAHLSNNIISGRTALTSGLSSTDELFVSDVSEAKLKRMDVSVLQNYLQSNLDFGSGSGTSLWSTSTTNNSNIVRESGNVGIGVSDPGDYKLAVNGTIRSKEVIVETANWADYVFEPDYKLKSLDEIEQFIKENGHLPDIPSATQVQKNGVGLAEMNILLLKKVEELTLYIIDQQKEINSLKSDLTEIRNEN